MKKSVERSKQVKFLIALTVLTVVGVGFFIFKNQSSGENANSKLEIKGDSSQRSDSNNNEKGAFSVFSVASGKHVSLVVEKYAFDEDDIARADLVEAFKYPYAKEKLGLRAIKRAYTYSVLLEKLGHTVGLNELEGELRRIDQSTLDPQKWSQMKGFFGDNHNQLLKILILPIYVERVLPFQVFPRSDIVHNESKEKARKIYDSLRGAGKNTDSLWLEFKEKEKLQEHHLCVHREKPTVAFEESADCKKKKGPHGPPKGGGIIDQSPQAAEGEMMKKKIQQAHGGESHSQSIGEIWATQLAPTVKEGEISPRLIETPENYLIVRLDKKKSTKKGEILMAQFTSLEITKTRLDDWVREKSATLHIVEMK